MRSSLLHECKAFLKIFMNKNIFSKHDLHVVRG